jgi:hypothetical protein
MEKELMAVVFAIDKFRSYLVGAKEIVYTDHAVLKYLQEFGDLSRSIKNTQSDLGSARNRSFIRTVSVS